MTKQIRSVSSFFVVLFVLWGMMGCTESFEPKGPFEEKLAVYAILSTQSDTQYVRLYTTYNPDGFNPLTSTNDKQVAGASVSLQGSEGTRLYRDTTITRDDQSRYSSNILAYVLSPFRPVPGNSYTLNIQLPSGKRTRGTVSVPGPGYLSVINIHVLQQPQFFDENLYVLASIAPRTRGFLLRMFVEFEITVDGRKELKRVEVPQRIRRFAWSDRFEKIYPKLQRRTSIENERNQGSEFVGFQNDAYVTTLKEIAGTYTLNNPIPKNAVFVLTQAEMNLYNYFNIVNGFQDEISIRTDQPDFSNIEGGVGIFGAMTVDSLTVSYR